MDCNIHITSKDPADPDSLFCFWSHLFSSLTKNFATQFILFQINKIKKVWLNF